MSILWGCRAPSQKPKGGRWPSPPLSRACSLLYDTIYPIECLLVDALYPLLMMT